MPKPPTKSLIRQSSRVTRVTVPGSENFDEDMQDEIQNDSDEEQEEGQGAADLVMGIRNMWNEVHDKSKKLGVRSTTFQNQKAALFAAGRKNANELVRASTASLEGYRERIRQLKSQELSYKELSKNAMPLFAVHDKSVQSLLALYPSLMEDLFPRRSQQMNATSEMLLSHPSDRARSLKTFLKDANAQLEQSREKERLATDAADFIKHYKSLLLTS